MLFFYLIIVYIWIRKVREYTMKNMLNRLKEKQNKKGFTLVEIIVVLVILAILAAIAIPAVLGYVEDARKSQYIAEARSIYLVVQTEEAKMQAKDGVGAYDETKPDVMSHYNDLYRKLLDYGSAAEHIISKRQKYRMFLMLKEKVLVIVVQQETPMIMCLFGKALMGSILQHI